MLTDPHPARRAPIARRNGRPAWENAPPRKRASDLDRPFLPEEPRAPSLIERIFGGAR